MITQLILLLGLVTYPVDVEPYVRSFEQAGGVVVDIPIVVTPLDSSTAPTGYEFAAKCYPSERVIRLNKHYWDRASPVEKEITVWHELGHCFLGRLSHVPDILDTGCAASVMHPAVLPVVRCFQNNRTYYIRELFSGY
jgi:hypothetical protein